MSYSSSWAHGFTSYKQLTVVDDMNVSGSHELKVLDDMNGSWSWAHGSKCYEQLRIVDDMNN